MSKPPSRFVFVGNIPYGLSEEQIIDIFSSAGKVLNFHLVYDQQTGKARGYGFAEYPDVDSASSAVRNLNDYEIMNRKLRVDFSNERSSGNSGNDDAINSNSGGNNSNNNNNYSHTNSSNGNYTSTTSAGGSIPPLPAGMDLPPGVTCADAISRTLTTVGPSQLLDVLAQMKTLATNEPARCAELLEKAPQLSFAIFQALILMGLASPEAIQSVLEPGSAAPIPPPPQVTAIPQAYQQPQQQVPPVGYPGVAGAMVPPVTNTPPAAMPYAPPAAAPALPLGQDPEALMRAVMELPQATIDALPESERQQILALRASFASQRR